VDVSVIIPTMGRGAKLVNCLRSLAVQRFGDASGAARYEVLVGFDGPDAAGAAAAREAWPAGMAEQLRVVECERSGLAAVRNRLLEFARGRILISTNDDVIASPRFVAAHWEAHEEARARGQVVVVSGYSPWVVHEPDRAFDRLVRETSMVFFYDKMQERKSHIANRKWQSEREQDWGFRHAWGLNMSAPTGAARDVGGFSVFPAWYGYEDNEIAFRIAKRYGAPVVYRPEAMAHHDHRMQPRGYLEREFKLGYAALGFSKQAGECARAMFGRDVFAAPELSYSREFLRREEKGAARLLKTFEQLADLPAGVFDGEHGATLRTLAYDQHLLLKRWMWRAGLVAAAEGRDIGDVLWPSDAPAPARLVTAAA
jgi:glycosyltransferase involved in cell wall biosynthesis